MQSVSGLQSLVANRTLHSNMQTEGDRGRQRTVSLRNVSPAFRSLVASRTLHSDIQTERDRGQSPEEMSPAFRSLVAIASRTLHSDLEIG